MTEITNKRVYVILEGTVPTGVHDERTLWSEIGRHEASSASGAKRAAIEAKTGWDKGTEIIAVPERYWKPTTPTVTAQTVLKIEGV